MACWADIVAKARFATTVLPHFYGVWLLDDETEAALVRDRPAAPEPGDCILTDQPHTGGTPNKYAWTLALLAVVAAVRYLAMGLIELGVRIAKAGKRLYQRTMSDTNRLSDR